jgi:solute:Na+ symporter, SSS family
LFILFQVERWVFLVCFLVEAVEGGASFRVDFIDEFCFLDEVDILHAFAEVALINLFFKKITPKAGEYTMITGFLIGMLRLVTNVITDTGKATMDGAFWDYTAWFWQTNWLVFECWLLVFLIIFMVVVSCFTPAPSKEQVEAITFTSDFKKSIRESWSAFDIIGTLVVIGLCAAFYAYFW